jgi:hypothetical protein
LQAPAEVGPAQIRYISGQGGKVLGRLDIEIVDHDVSDARPVSSSSGPAAGAS